MATWKKVIVSGSTANLSALQVDNLTSGEVVIGGGSGNLTTTAINGTGNIVATTGASGLVHSGSFSGSFQGTFTGTTNLPDLTQGTGITAFTYDGSTTATVAVSGASTLNSNTVTKWTGNAFANTNITDNGSLVNINSATNITGSLNVTGSQVVLNTDAFYVQRDFGAGLTSLLYVDNSGVGASSTDGSGSLDAELRQLYDAAANNSVDWTNRQLIKSDGTTVTVDWENGLFSGSFSGSFQGDGSQLTGLVSTLYISGSTGGGSVSLLTQTLTIAGTTNEIETSAAGQTITIGLPNDVTIGNDLTVQGNFTVNGTTTVINTTNTSIEDQFVLLASGSTGNIDGGIIVQNAAAAGEALYWEANPGGNGRWAIASSVSPTATTVTVAEYVVTATSSLVAPSAAPVYGSTTSGYGNIYINSSNGDIYIYS